MNSTRERERFIAVSPLSCSRKVRNTGRCMLLLAKESYGLSQMWELVPWFLHHWPTALVILSFLEINGIYTSPMWQQLNCNELIHRPTLMRTATPTSWLPTCFYAVIFSATSRQLAMRHFKLQSLAPSNTLSKPSVVRSIEKRTSLLSSSCITIRFVHPSIVLNTCWSRSINSSRTSTMQRSSLELSRNYFFDSVLSQSVSATIFADEGPCIGFFALSSSALTCGWAFYFALECSPISFVSSITSGMVESFANNKKIAFFPPSGICPTNLPGVAMQYPQQGFIATLLFDSSMSALPIVVLQKSRSAGLFTH